MGVGDDSWAGVATAYDIRYKSCGSSPCAFNWDTMTQVSGEPTPQAYPAIQYYTINNLNPNTMYWFAIRARDEANNWNSVSKTLRPTPSNDVIPPGTTTDLRVVSYDANAVTLAWTAPAEDGASGGRVASYNIRYSTSPITSANWGSATSPLSPAPIPTVPGVTEQMTIVRHPGEDFFPDTTTYHFALKARDEVPNQWSLLSNTVFQGESPCSDTNIVTSYSYSPRNWVSGIKIANVQTIENNVPVLNTLEETYAYDAVGNMNYVKEFENITGGANRLFKRTAFGYDNLNRLTSASGVNGQPGDPNPSDPLQKTGRYYDNIAWSYDPIGNFKSNYELEYCYTQAGVDACGTSITSVDNNKVKKTKAFGSNIDTTYTYDPYGNIKTESSWQEIPVGDIDYLASQPNKLFLLFADGLIPSGTSIRIMYYHEQNGILGLNQKEQYAWATIVANTGYSGTKSGHWDGTPYILNSRISSTTVLGGTTGPGTDFYNNLNYPDSPAKPHIKQYFRAYKQTTTTYCWDYANRMVAWYDSAVPKNCQAYFYDATGSRIKKITKNGADTQGHQTIYITQGTNVLYEEESDVDFACPTTCT
jgi:hypothetical protein